jgi:hypothetical protein
MKRDLLPSAAVITLLLAWTSAEAQSPNFTLRSYPDVTDSYQSGLKTYYKTWGDLNEAQKHVAAYPGDWYRFDVARGQMDLLERTWENGRFDRAEINTAIDNVQLVLKFNNLAPGDRQALAADLDGLRDIRLRYGE